MKVTLLLKAQLSPVSYTTKKSFQRQLNRSPFTAFQYFFQLEVQKLHNVSKYEDIINYNYTTLPHSRLGSGSSNNTNTNTNNFTVGSAPGALMAPTTSNDFSFNLDQSNDSERSCLLYTSRCV